jgi:hypothetical protein
MPPNPAKPRAEAVAAADWWAQQLEQEPVHGIGSPDQTDFANSATTVGRVQKTPEQIEAFRVALAEVIERKLSDRPEDWRPDNPSWGSYSRTIAGDYRPAEELETAAEEAGFNVTDLVPRQPDATPAVYDAATLAVLAAMEEAADKHLDAIRPHNTKRGYANDWALWEEFHDWLAERTGQPLPLTAVTKGTLVGFVVWLDTIKAPHPTASTAGSPASPSPRAAAASKSRRTRPSPRGRRSSRSRLTPNGKRAAAGRRPPSRPSSCGR